MKRIFSLILMIGTAISCSPDEKIAPNCNFTPITTPDKSAHDKATDYVWTNSEVTKITLSNAQINIVGKGALATNGKIVISEAGNYSLKGELSSGQIIIEANADALVRIILEGVDITSNLSSAIYVKKAKKVIVILAENTTNKITDANSYTFDDVVAQEPNACLFSKCDLTLTGEGSLTINARFEDGIASKDGLVFKSGKISINAKDDAIRSKDYVIFRSGKFDINALKDGIKATGKPEEGRGYVIIDNGNFDISAGDDGIHAEGKNTINNGNINVLKSFEGIEGQIVTINGGNINVNATDDGISASDGTDSGSTATQTTREVSMNINGGYVVVNSTGDVYDSNGMVNISGGIIIGHGPADRLGEVFDYDCSFNITGGILIGVGAEPKTNFTGSLSTQNVVSINLTPSQVQAANTLIRLTNGNGQNILVFQSLGKFQTILFSAPNLSKGNYDLFLGGSSTGNNVGGLISGGNITGGTKNQAFAVSELVTLIGPHQGPR
jgi:Carbohydrate-binding domain-containing protein Cthe_2159